MSTEMLERQHILTQDADEDLHEQAKKVLNYDPAIKLPFAVALRKMDVAPFTTASVEAYKASKLNSPRDRVLRICGQISDRVTFFWFIGSLVALVANIFFDVGAWGHLFGSLVMSVVTGLSFEAFLSQFNRMEWAKIPIADYKEPVPEFVLQTAVDLKARFPEVEVWIEKLQKSEKTYDPFLIAKVGEEEYYLEVWNEPGFQGKRES